MKNKIISILKFKIFKSTWREKNKHNETIAGNVFPIDKVTVGNYSYGRIKFISWGSTNERLEIGSFVSIAGDVVFLGGGNHKMDIFTTYPFKVKFQKEPLEAISKGPIIIEDDVWIGQEAFILSGVKISQGAVVAARSVVTKNIPPYAIVGGNPAKIIRYRFTEEQITKLIGLDYSKISADFFLNNNEVLNGDIDTFLTSTEFKIMAKKEP